MTGLLLVGGTGLLGGRIAERLAARDVPFRALVRPQTDASHLEALEAEIVRGDLRDEHSLTEAVTGATTVVTTANAIGRLLAGAKDLSIDSVDRQGNASLVHAAERAGVGRFMFLSIGGLSPAMAARSPLAAAKVETERLLRASTMRSVIVRPAAYQEVWLSPATGIRPAKRLALIYGHGRTPWPLVAVDDVAELVVRLALADDPPAELDFGGPQRLTRHEVVAAFERATGTKFRRVSIPRPVMALGGRLLRRRNPAIASVMGMSLSMDMTEVTFDDRPLRELGIEPRSTTEAIEEMVRSPSRTSDR